MGDFAASDLRGPDSLYPQHTNAPCPGCNTVPADDDRCFADYHHIWHSSCWPSTDGSRTPPRPPER